MVNAAFLVERERRPEFEDAVESVGEALAGRDPAAAARPARSLRLRRRGVSGGAWLTGLLGLPLAPVRGVLWLAEQVREQAEEQFYDPARIRAQLDRVDEARRSGELSDEECAELENELLQRLMHRRG